MNLRDGNKKERKLIRTKKSNIFIEFVSGALKNGNNEEGRKIVVLRPEIVDGDPLSL